MISSPVSPPGKPRHRSLSPTAFSSPRARSPTPRETFFSAIFQPEKSTAGSCRRIAPRPARRLRSRPGSIPRGTPTASASTATASFWLARWGRGGASLPSTHRRRRSRRSPNVSRENGSTPPTTCGSMLPTASGSPTRPTNGRRPTPSSTRRRSILSPLIARPSPESPTASPAPTGSSAPPTG